MRMFAVACVALGWAALTMAAAQADDLIKTLNATYGTSAGHSCDATATIASACDGRMSCDVLASNGLCGDPEYGTPKTLDIVYQCGPAVGRSVSASEESIAHLSCE